MPAPSSKKLIMLLTLISIGTIWLLPNNFNRVAENFFELTIIQLLLTIIMILIGSFYFYISHSRAQTDDTSSRKLAYSQQLKRLLKNSIAICQLLLNKQQRYLRKLPWYVILGATQSGKNSLLHNSGLTFFEDPTLKFIGSATVPRPSLWRWYIATEALVFTIAIPLLTAFNSDAALLAADHCEGKHSRTWSDFLNFVKFYRRRRPLHGIVICLSITELLTIATSTEQLQSQTLPLVYGTLQRTLKIAVPIFLVITHCDELAGFQEYFADLTQVERQQSWGVTLPDIQVTSATERLTYFSNAFDELITRLQQRLFTRLATEPDIAKRSLLSYFPQQLQLCKAPLLNLINTQPTHPYQGIYWLSNQQTEVTQDFLLSALSVQFNLATSPYKTKIPTQKIYFAQCLFKDIFLPIGNAYRQTQSEHAPVGWHRYRDWLLVTGILLLCTAGLSGSYIYNQTELKRIEYNLQDYQSALMRVTATNDSFSSILPLLNTLRTMRDNYANANRGLLYFEIYQPWQIRQQLTRLYNTTLTQLLLPCALRTLATSLRSDTNSPELLYQTLRAYLVFTRSPRARSIWLLAPLMQMAQLQFSNQPLAFKQFTAHLVTAAQLPIPALELQLTLIATARARLRQLTSVELAYYAIKQASVESTSPLNLLKQPQDGTTFIFTPSSAAAAQIPRFFTWQSYKNLYNHKNSVLAQYLAEIDWVLDLPQQAKYSAFTQQISPAFWQLYTEDYAAYWQRALRRLHIQPATNLTQAITQLDNLLKPNNPLLNALLLLKANTLPLQSHHSNIANQFSTLNYLTGLPNKQNAEYSDILKNLEALRTYLITLNQAPARDQAAFEAICAYVRNQPSTNPLVKLKLQAQQLPMPLQQWLIEIINSTLDILLQGAYTTINTAWQKTVIPVYKTTLQKQLMFSKSEHAADFTAFTNFFGAAGIFMQFYNNYLIYFIDTTKTPWQAAAMGTHGLNFASGTLAALQRIASTSALYFPNNTSSSGIQFYIKPHLLDAQTSRVYLHLGSRTFSYAHGPQQTFVWHWFPGSAQQQISIVFNDFKEQDYVQTFEGPWAWLQLLQASQLRELKESGHYLWTIKLHHHLASFEIWTANQQSILNLNLLNNRSLPETF